MPVGGNGTIAVILGASEWPKYDTLDSSPWFKDSADRFKEYLLSPKGLRVPPANVLNLFDADLHPGAVGEKIQEFISQRLIANDGLSDLLFYYVGHGGYLHEKEYFLALRSTNKTFKEATVFKISYLVSLLGDLAREKRNLMILDACYSGAAMGEFSHMAATEDAAGLVHEQVSTRLPPSEGTVLFCAAGPRKWAKVSLEGPLTMFSGALLKVLEGGEPTAGPFLTLQKTAELVSKEIERSFGSEGARPQIHVPVQAGGYILAAPFFPNPTYSVADFEGRLSHLEKSIQDLNSSLQQARLDSQRYISLEDKINQLEEKGASRGGLSDTLATYVAPANTPWTVPVNVPWKVRAFLEGSRSRKTNDSILFGVAVALFLNGIASFILYLYLIDISMGGSTVTPAVSGLLLIATMLLGSFSGFMTIIMMLSLLTPGWDYWNELQEHVQQYLDGSPQDSSLSWAEDPHVLRAYKEKYSRVVLFGEVSHRTALVCLFLFLLGCMGVIPIMLATFSFGDPQNLLSLFRHLPR